MSRFLVGRQPIFDEKLQVHGYELLFRDPVTTTGDAMTAEVLVHAGLDIGLDSLVGNKLVFVNATRSFIVGELPVSLPVDRVVIEVLENVAHDEDVLEGCRRLVREGYTLALDDYVWCAGDEPLLELVEVVKLDILALVDGDLERHVDLCSPFDVRLLAEKVETHQQLAACRELGFDLFQGYLLSRPNAVTVHCLTPSHLTCLRLIEKLCAPEPSTAEVTRMIESDPGLSYRFLRVAGMGARGHLRRQLRSVREGIVLLGTRRLRDWVALMLMAETHEGSVEQLTIALTRARMSELLADTTDIARRDSAFTIGLLSALDLFLDVPLREIVANMSISDELVEGLLDHKGELGMILSDILAWEIGGEGLEERLERDHSAVEKSYLQALDWAIEACRSLEHSD